MTKKGKKYYHNKGQQDRANGKKYNSPSTFLDWFEPSSSKLKKTDENTKSYRKGWVNQSNSSGGSGK